MFIKLIKLIQYNVKVEQFHLDMMNYESIENLIDLDQYDE